MKQKISLLFALTGLLSAGCATKTFNDNLTYHFGPGKPTKEQVARDEGARIGFERGRLFEIDRQREAVEVRK